MYIVTLITHFVLSKESPFKKGQETIFNPKIIFNSFTLHSLNYVR